MRRGIFYFISHRMCRAFALWLSMTCGGGGALWADDASREVQAEEAYQAHHYPEAIRLYTELAAQSAPEFKGEWLMRLALAHYRDQDDVAAFSSYLAALEAVDALPIEQGTPSSEESSYCEKALNLYLNVEGKPVREMAVHLGQTYRPIVEAHPEYHMLDFYVSAAYANLGMFDEFFERFFRCYQIYPRSFMAYKTKGILHLKLFERLVDTGQKETQRSLALRCFQRAKEENPQDSSLYRLAVTFASPGQRRAALRENLTHIVEQDIKTPRGDIQFFVEEAVRAHEIELGKRFLEKAKGWYQYSRVIMAAEEYLRSSTER